MVRALKLNSVYISKVNSIRIKFPLSHYQGTAEEWALLDSGATENFINHKTVLRLHLGSQKLTIRRPVYNVDRSPNQNGIITHAVDLLVKQGNRKERQRFYITDLGKDAFILGYPWYRTFNPTIDWGTGKIMGPLVRMETIRFGIYKQAKKWLKEKNDDLMLAKAECIPPPLNSLRRPALGNGLDLASPLSRPTKAESPPWSGVKVQWP